MAARLRLRLASTSSETTVKTWSDQPRITVWSRLDDRRAALAQLLQLAVQAAGEQTDQGADDEDAAEREHEPQREHRHGAVVRHGEGERGDERLPQQLERVVAGPFGRLDERQAGRDDHDERRPRRRRASRSG